MYKRLKGTKGIPKVYWIGTEGDYNIMAMELLGPSLEFVFKKCDRHFSTATVVSIALQLVRLLLIISHRFLEFGTCILKVSYTEI